MSGRSLTDPTSISADGIESLFRFGQRSRASLRELIATVPPEVLDVEREFTILDHLVRVAPRKIIVHVVLHEIRHWAQIATLLRLHGMKTEFHDFLVSPILGGESNGLATSAS